MNAAIEDALRDAPGWHDRGILVSPVLLATRALDAHDELLYRAVYTLFCAMPWRLVPKTSFYVSTLDVEGGVELAWEGREERTPDEDDLRGLVRGGPYGDLADIALAALERFCHLRAGSIETSAVELPASRQFPRGAAIARRIVAFLPASRAEGLAHPRVPRATPALQEDIATFNEESSVGTP